MASTIGLSSTTSSLTLFAMNFEALLRPPIFSALSAALPFQHNLPNLNPLVRRLEHIVDRGGRDADGYHGLHFDTRLGGCRDFGLDSDAILAHAQIDINDGQGQWMTHGDQFGGPFGGHDAGNTGYFERIAFGIMRECGEHRRFDCHESTGLSLALGR